ncbi:MAG: GPI inositol-deacylase [Gammaproteobacteria bacterium]|nr:GPI inositol-deacylase [Gammaproteobacteria bacterium]
MAFDATKGIAGIVEKMHRTIQLQPGPLGRSATDRPRGITGFVYRSVQGGLRLVGQSIDSSLAPIAELLPEGESSPARDAFRSAVNGVFGDYLLLTGNPLAIDMSLRNRGQRIDLENPASAFSQNRDATRASKLLVLVHGLCMNDRQWHREEHDHGAALADEFGYVPLYLRYNSGLHIANNGRALAEMLETVIRNWTSPVKELVIIGHSMGGLVARSASHYGLESGHVWPKHLQKLVFLGTPHHGAPLERGGHGLDFVMELSPYSAPLNRIARTRSAGITDLRHGTITTKAHQPVPLPAGVKCYAAAAILAGEHNVPSERLIGDGLVPLDSALGLHHDATRTLAIPKEHQAIAHRTRHVELLNHPDVYTQLRRWLDESS